MAMGRRSKMKLHILQVATVSLVALPNSFAAGDALNDLLLKYDQKAPAGAVEEHPASKPVPKNAAPKEQRAPVAQKTKSPANGYTLQAGSYTELEDTQSRVDQLARIGLEVWTSEAVVNGIHRYRVNVGRFPSKREASAFRSEKMGAAAGDAFVVVEAGMKFELISKSKIVEEVPEQAKPQVEAPAETREPASVTEAKPALPASPDVPPEEPSYGAFGDWGGLKPKLLKSGVSVDIKYKGEIVRNMAGGLETKSDYLGNVDVVTDLDLETLAGLKGINLVLYGLGDHGGHPSSFIGESLVTSNIEAPSTFKLYEAYLKKTFDERFTALFGLRDLNADYYATESSGSLRNSAFGISPSLAQTGVNGPSIFPTTALALSFRYESPDAVYFQSGIFNARAGDPEQPYGTHIATSVDDGYLFIWEAGLIDRRKGQRGKLGIGAWSYSEPADAIDPDVGKQANSGLYLLVDQQISDRISAFLKYGVATPAANQFRRSVESGIAIDQPFAGRDLDQLVMGVASALASDDYQRIAESKAEESVFELTYRVHVREGLALFPDYQYVKNPGLAQEVTDAQVGTLKFEIQF